MKSEDCDETHLCKLSVVMCTAAAASENTRRYVFFFSFFVPVASCLEGDIPDRVYVYVSSRALSSLQKKKTIDPYLIPRTAALIEVIGARYNYSSRSCLVFNAGSRESRISKTLFPSKKKRKIPEPENATNLSETKSTIIRAHFQLLWAW